MQETDITPDCVNYHFFKRNKRSSKTSRNGCHSRGIVSGPHPTIVLSRRRKIGRSYGLRKRSVTYLTGNHTTLVAKVHARAVWRRRSSQSLHRCVWKTPWVGETTAMVVDGYCLIWANNSGDKISECSSVLETDTFWFVIQVAVHSSGTSAKLEIHTRRGCRTNTLTV